MTEITSVKNPIISHMRLLGREKSARDECREYIGDGSKLLQEAVRWAGAPEAVLWAKEPDVDLPASTQQFRVPQELLDRISPMKNCPGVMFLMKKPETQDTEISGSVIVLETVQDPGNLGTVLRTANAMGIGTVVLTGECADLYSPKTLRASMGAVFRQKVVAVPLSELKKRLSEHHLRLYGAALSDRSEDIRTVSSGGLAVAIGSEGRGLSPDLLSLCDGQLIIPMNGMCESLNAAAAAAIVMWELFGRTSL